MKIVVLDGYTLNPGDLSWDLLKQKGDSVIYDRTVLNEIVDRCRSADAVLTNKVPLSAETIAKLPSLKYIGVTATGYNIIDMEAAKARDILVTNVPGYSSASVAQLCFAFILEQAHHVQRHSDAVKKGKWSQSQDFCFWDYPLVELEGKTIGIIGFGTIGQQLADYAAAFGMNVIGQSRTQTAQSHRKKFRWASLEELLGASDYVSIHCPLTPETKNLINKKTLSLMKKSAFLINTARGPIVNDAELAEALNNEVIAGAGIDVLSTEPPAADNPLFKAKNCLITPHIGWATREARARLMDTTLNNIDAFIAGQPINVVN